MDGGASALGATTTGASLSADLLIVGGGLIGAATALAAAKVGLSAIVADRTPLAVALADDFDGRAYAVALATRRFLAHLGLWDQLAADAQEIEHILVSDGRPGERASDLALHFDRSELGRDGFGHMLEDRRLRRALVRAADAHAEIRYLAGAEITALDRGDAGVSASLSDGRVLRATLAVACDGRDSALRREAGVGRVHVAYDQVGLVCALACEKPHFGVAHEFFLPSGPFAILPLTGQRVSLVWTERGDLADALGGVSDALYLAEVKRRLGDLLGEVRLLGKRWAYPLSLSFANDFAAPRLALVGDAARGVHPVAGQGMNYGMRDAAALAEVLGAAARRGEDLGDLGVLQRYETWRRPDSVGVAAATDALNRLFSNDIGPIRWARRFGVAAFGQVGPLRRAAMRLAAGDMDSLPRAMRG